MFWMRAKLSKKACRIVRFQPKEISMRYGKIQILFFVPALVLGLLIPARALDSTSTTKGTEAVAEILYRHPTKRARDYDKFFVAPVTLKPNEKSNTLSPEELKVFAEAFTTSARESLSNSKKPWTVVDEPGAGALTIQMTVLEFEPVKPQATGKGDVAIRFDTTGRGGSLLLSGIDGASGEKIIELRQQLIGPKYLLGDQKTRLMNMLDAFRVWGSLLQMRLAELKGEGAAK
jgi:hypothetical protein